MRDARECSNAAACSRVEHVGHIVHVGLGSRNVDWRQADPATAALDEYDLLISAFGVMFFGDRVAAFTNMRFSVSPRLRFGELVDGSGQSATALGFLPRHSTVKCRW
jgi:hypothetical protein